MIDKFFKYNFDMVAAHPSGKRYTPAISVIKNRPETAWTPR
jgi:hypothetical protein